MATYYRWTKNTATISENEATITQVSVGSKIYLHNDKPTVNQSTGKYVFTDYTSMSSTSTVTLTGSGKYAATSTSPRTIYLGTGASGMEYRDNKLTAYGGSIRRYSISIGADENLGYVYSVNSGLYPNNDMSGGYYYNNRTTITSPTTVSGLTYSSVLLPDNILITWTAATSNVPNYPVSLYEVSYSINNGTDWTVAGTTSNTSYSATLPDRATSVMFRVRAKDSNSQWGDYVTGTASQVLLAPTLTVPQMVMQGQQATISWTAVEGADSYTLQRKANTDADWTQVYSGANLSYTETVGTWTSLQYRVQGVFDGTPGGWATSGSIPVVSSSALVISGTDGDLGTVVNDIPYSISTDTGNQITATITVNSAVIFSGNVGNSTADVIPVLDLVNGEGTIVIEASVTASGGPVSAARTWTYTKSLITFPDAGSVAQLTQQGANIWPKTLAECVRLPGGKTLDEVTGFPCQVYSGSYVGTGTSGSSNPNTLTFPFEPKFLIIETVYPGGTSTTFSFAVVLDDFGIASSLASQGSSPTFRSLTVTKSGNQVSWYGTNADFQQNRGTTYKYVAIG